MSWRALLPPDAPERHTPLALGVELRQRETARAAHWGPRRVEAVTARDLAHRQSDLLVGLRPLVRGTRGQWIKGTVSWDSVRRPGGAHDPAQARWFAELYTLARDLRVLGAFSDVSEWVTLDAVESALLWAHLARATDLGIPFVPTRPGLSVRLAEAAEATLEIAPDGAGLRLSAHVRIDGAPVDGATVRPVGRTGVYAFAIEGPAVALTLAPAPLGDAVHAVLASGAPLTVPAADRAEFLRDAYPRLSRQGDVSAARGFEPPPIAPPVLVARVRFHPGDEIAHTLEWEYPDGRRHPYPPGGGPERDSDGEAHLRTVVEHAWTQAGPLAFAAEGMLRGIDAAEFGAHVLPALEALDGVRVEVSGAPRAYHELTGDPRITVSTLETTDVDWFDLGVLVTIDGRRIPFRPLFTALALGRKKLLLSDGRYFSLAHPALHRLRDLIDEAADLDEWETGPRISRYQLPLWSDFEDLADVSEPAVSWRETASALRDVERVESTPPPAGLTAELRPYQQAGLDWLAFLWQHRLGGILADDMGLGKTLQVLALLAHARERGERRPFLVVAPTSVLSTWRDEAARFAPDLAVRLIQSTEAKSGMPVSAAAADADVVVTSYTLLRLDEPAFTALEWGIVVLDEAQFVKNPQTRLYRAAHALRTPVAFAVTGTPLENTLGELWTILSLTSPGLFPSARRFREEYIKPIERGKVPENAEGGPYRARRLERLRHRIRPFLLRRTKDLVATDLPPRQEQELHIELNAAHRAVYDTVLQRERRKILGLLDDLDRNRFIVFRSLTLLRMLALAPSLVDADDGSVRSSKLDALLEQLDEIVAEGHRTLVFSQFTSYLALVAQALDARGIRYTSLDGSTRNRARIIEGFRTGDDPVFLISLKAGGFGLTLTEADYVFLLDPWWNPAAEAQAVDRTHRIGQTRPVNVYRLIAAGTIEEKVMALQQRKARLFRAVMDDDALFSQALTADDIRGLFDHADRPPKPISPARPTGSGAPLA
ncbi:DEAD/DEAH box helicase [Microbacterium terricola]|uniref:DNA helicase n=1 Tax=Microbacterium terricola TaxID=344163 RepID=A0ABM8DYC1_9MICO|nr:DEAD/DEAH box helicase [Microbacterium terricola]UYK38725.1 SNF2 family helicase [Microbacterium terricola]BDV30585.1 DNA helicase [Microbacterium terricola]